MTKLASKTLNQFEGYVRKRSAELGLSVSEIAQRSGLTRAYLHALLSGKTRNPGVLTLARLAGALKIPSVSLYRLFEQVEDEFLRGGGDAKRSGSGFAGGAIDGIAAEQQGAHGHKHFSIHDPEDVLIFTEDVTIPDHSMVMPGQRFTKTWAVQNAGRVHWRERRLARIDQELVIARRDAYGLLTAVLDSHLHSLGRDLDIPDTPPGHGVELSVDFMAPRENCSVASLWRFVDRDGQPIYRDACFLQVIVNVLGA